VKPALISVMTENVNRSFSLNGVRPGRPGDRNWLLGVERENGSKHDLNCVPRDADISDGFPEDWLDDDKQD
jgi:hypothetical protein